MEHEGFKLKGSCL